MGGEGAVVGPYLRGVEPVEEVQALGGGEPSGVVGGGAVLDGAGEPVRVLPGGHQRPDPAAVCGGDGEDGAAGGGVPPFVQVAEPEVGAPGERVRDHAGDVRPVDDGGDPAGGQVGEQPGRGDEPGGGRADVVEQRHLGTGRQPGQHGLAYGVLVGQVRVQRDGVDPRAAGGGRDDRAVAVVGDQDLVTVGERDGVEGEVGALGGVGDEGHAVGVGAEVPCDTGAGPGDPVRGADEEGVRIGVQLRPERGLGLLHGERYGAEGPVVEVGDLRIQPEQPGSPGEHGGGGRTQRSGGGGRVGHGSSEGWCAVARMMRAAPDGPEGPMRPRWPVPAPF